MSKPLSEPDEPDPIEPASEVPPIEEEEEKEQTIQENPESPRRKPKRPVGRPREAKGYSHTPDLPPKPRPRPPNEIVPPRYKYGHDLPAGHRPADFFQWWNSLDKPEQQRLMIYVYRVWPVGFKVEENPKTGKVTQSRRMAQVPGEAPIHDLEEFKQRYGSGDYAIRCNEQVYQRKTIARCLIRIRDPEFPPVIPDVQWLDLSDPANESYIESLRLKGVDIPGDKSRARDDQEKEDMAVTEAVTELAGTVKDLTRQAVEAAQRRPEPAAPNLDSQAQLKAIELVQKAGETACKIVETAAGKMGDMQKERTPTPANDLAATVGVLKELVAAMRPDNSLDTVLKLLHTAADKEGELYKQLMGLQQGQIAQLQASVDRMVTERQTAATVANPSMANQIREMADMKNLLRDFLGVDEEDEDRPSRGSRSGGLLEAAVNNAPGILAAIGGIISGVAAAAHNAAVARTGQGTPIPVPPPAPVTQPGELTTGPIEATGPVQPGSTEAQMQIHQQVRALTGPLVKALNEDKTGDEFAEILIEYAGSNAYEQLAALGKDGILMLLQVYARDVYGLVMSMPARFNQFLDEFLAYATEEEEPKPAAPAMAPKKIKAVRTAKTKPTGEPEPRTRIPASQPEA